MTFRIATLPGDCPNCKRNIRKGEVIVLVDTKWLHAVCTTVFTPSFARFVCEMSDALVNIAFSHPALDDYDTVVEHARRVIFRPGESHLRLV